MAGGVSGTEIRRGGASGGVLTETKPGMAAEAEKEEGNGIRSGFEEGLRLIRGNGG